MDVVFMGTPEFAVPILEALHDSHRVIGVYTRPDAASKRGNRLIPPPVKAAAERLGLPVFQPATLRDPDEHERLSSLHPDVVCVAAYGVILPPEVLEIPPHGCINVHASLLPKYRGAAPVHRAVLDGDPVTGVSIMLMEEGLDTGPYAMQRSVPVDDMTVPELTTVLADVGATALVEVLGAVEAREVVWTAQDDSVATYAAKITRQDTALCPELKVDSALRRVRASTTQAPARLMVGDTPITVIGASRSVTPLEPGSVRASGKTLEVGLADGSIRLERIRPAGKGDMDGAAWVCGARLPAECRWSAAS